MQSRNFTGTIQRGQAVYSSLYNTGLGYVVSVDENCNQGDCQTLGGGIGGSGGGSVHIVYVKGSLSDYPECLLRSGVQIGMLPEEENADDETLERLIENAHLVRRQADEKEAKRKEAFQAEVEALKADPELKHLIPVALAKGSEEAHVAKNMRVELKKAGIKGVKVRKDNNTVLLEWTDGAPESVINAIAIKYKSGHFNSYEDYYEHSDSPFTTVFGGAQYVRCHRSYSDETVERVLKQAAAKYSQSPISLESYKRGGLNSVDYDREFYDVIHALDLRPVEEPKPSKPAAQTAPATESCDCFFYKQGEHTKTHATLHIVELTENLERERFVCLKQLAKSFKGYYSRFVSGFIFQTEADAKAFMHS